MDSKILCLGIVFMMLLFTLNLAITEDDFHSVKISLSQLFPDALSDKIIMSFDLDVIIIYLISYGFMTTSKVGAINIIKTWLTLLHQ